MRFDFNEKERKIIEDFSYILNQIPGDGSFLYNKANLSDIINKLSKTIYFDTRKIVDEEINLNSILFKIKSDLCSKNFYLYLIAELGINFIRNILEDQNLSDYISSIMNSKNIIIPAYVEDNMNFHLKEITTTAILNGDYYIVSGTKKNVLFLDWADYVLLLAKYEDNLIFFILNKDEVEIKSRENLYGIDLLTISEILIKEKKIPKDRCVGPILDKNFLDNFFYSINRILIPGSIGLMQKSFEEARVFAKQHKNGGKPIIAYQEVGFKLAEMKTLLDASYLIAAKAMNTENKKQSYETNLVAKVFCLESLENIASSALSILSTYGFTDKYLSGNILMLSKFFQVNGTSTEVSRVNLGDLCLGYKKI